MRKECGACRVRKGCLVTLYACFLNGLCVVALLGGPLWVGKGALKSFVRGDDGRQQWWGVPAFLKEKEPKNFRPVPMLDRLK